MALRFRRKARSARAIRRSGNRTWYASWEALEDRIALSFAAPVVYPVGTQNSLGLNGFGPQVATGDFYGDGKLDLAVTNTVDGTLSILRGNGDGSFQPAVTYDTGLGANNPVWPSAVDFDGNGKLDVAVEGNNGLVSILLNKGNGSFTAPKTYGVGTADRGGLAVGDYFGNGRQDIAVAAFTSNNVQILPNNGDGTFGAAVIVSMPSSFHNIRSTVTGNFFGNGYADQSTPEPGSVGILYGNGDGTFQGPIQYTPYVLPGGLAVADFNGDGRPDLAVTQNYTGHSVGVMLNQPNSATLPPTVTSLCPATGPTTGGTVVTITGTNFAGTSQVDFGSVPAKSFAVVSGTTITATAPAGSAGAVDVSVYNAGASATSPADHFTYNAGASATSPADHFTYNAVVQAPAVTHVDPAIGSTAGGTVVTITGTNFTGASAVRFGGVLATSFTVNSSASITAAAPAESAGAVDVTVITPGGTSPTSSLDRFTYQAPALTTIAVSPSTASVMDGATQLFVATALDQFGKPLATQPAFTWSVYGVGSIQSSGLYSAPASGTGTSYVKATSGSVYGYATVTIAPASDTWTGLGVTYNWSDPANWSTNAAPVAGATVIFSSISTKNAFIDPNFAGTIGALQIYPGYSGMVVQGRNLTVNGALNLANGIYNAAGYSTVVLGLTTVSGGTFVASTSPTNLAAGLIVSGGIFAGSSGEVTTNMVTLSSGTLIAPAGTLAVTGGNFTYTGGTFNANQGTVVYANVGATPTVSVGTGLISFYNFTDALASAGTSFVSMTIVGTLTVNGTLAWKNSFNGINGNIEARGDVDDENHGGIGNPILTLDGGANQKIGDLSGAGGGQFRTITINKTGGTVSLACNPIDFSGLTLTTGTVNTGAYSWVVTGPISATPGLNLGNVEVDGSGVTVVGTSLQVANLTFAAAVDKLTAPTGNLYVSGNWNDAVGVSFAANGGTVVFDGTGGTQDLNGGGATFNNLTILAGSSVELQADLIVAGTFTNLGTFNANGHKVLK